MNKEIKAAVKEVKEKLTMRGAYPAIVAASNGTLTLDIVKKTFSGRTTNIGTIETVLMYARVVIKADEKQRRKQIAAIKKFATA